jgi:hypothetical protein
MLVEAEVVHLAILDRPNLAGRERVPFGRRGDAVDLAVAQLRVGGHDRLHLGRALRRLPLGRHGQAVTAFLARLEALVTRQSEFDTMKQLFAVRVLEVHQLRVVVELTLRRADGEQNGVLHTHQRHDHLVKQLVVDERRLLQDDQLGRTSSQTCCTYKRTECQKSCGS